MISTDLESQRMEKVILSEIFSVSESKILQNIGRNISKRIGEDKVEFQDFLEKANLMKYYDQLWEIGVDNLDELANCTVEDFNNLKIPMGHQVKI